MREVHYKPEDLEYPIDWKKKAAIAIQEVIDAPYDQKSTVVNNHSKLWSELKHELSKIMYGKCWYTESPQSGTDCDIDHFRPKNSVKGVKKEGSLENHPGYWWLAFSPENYRYSCIVANRARRDLETGIVGGKADEFPLLDERNRAWCKEETCDDEQPTLLDPCNPADVSLLEFAENGEAIARFSEGEKPIAHIRADVSISLYHLNHSDFVNDRIKIRDNIKKNINDAHRYYRFFGTEYSNANNDFAYMRAVQELKNTCKIDAPYSSYAIAILKPYRYDESLEPVFRGI